MALVYAALTWLDKDGNELTENLPDSVTVQLKAVVQNNAGKTVEIDAGKPVQLTEAKGWKHLFESLSKTIPAAADYPAQKVSYTIAESPVAGFTSKVTVAQGIDGTYTATPPPLLRPAQPLAALRCWVCSVPVRALR